MTDAVKDAQELYTAALDASRSQRVQLEEDLRFTDPSDPDQWEPAVKSQRENDPGGRRPCLVVDQIGQYVANIAGQVEQQPPSIHALPVEGPADKKSAEQIDGRFRHIEHASRAAQHYARAITSAARVGVGYLTVRAEYINRALGWQEPRIGSEGDPLRVVFDPWSTETDGSDATFAFRVMDVDLRMAKQRWPKIDDFADFGELGVYRRSSDERKSVVIAEHEIKQEDTRLLLVYADPESGEEVATTKDVYDNASLFAGRQLEVIRSYRDKYTCVKWRLMTGNEVLEEMEYPASYIGTVPVYGYIGFANGRLTYCGMGRRARVPQQAYNYHASEQLAYIGTAPKSPWWVSARAAKGFESLLDKMSTESRAWMPYNDVDESERPIVAPSRISPSVNLTNHVEGAQQALRDIQAALGLYQANLGAPSNETSGVAIENRKQQGEASTGHFPAHLAASMGQVGRIVIEMDAKLLDAKRKVAVMGVDRTVGSITIDPNQKAAYSRNEQGIVLNPNAGSYGVRAVVGASYSTQRAQTNAAFSEIMRAQPDLAQAVAPFWAQTLDFPGSDKFAQAMAALAPPPIRALLQPDDGSQDLDPTALTLKLQEVKGALDEALKHAEAAQQDADQAHAAQAKMINDLSVQEKELNIKAYQAETDRAKLLPFGPEEVKQLVAETLETMLSHPDPLPGDTQEAGPETDEPAEPQSAAPQSAAPAEPQEESPPQMSPDIQALMQAHQATQQHQQGLMDSMGKLADAATKPKKRVLVRDKQGNVTHLVETAA